MPVSLYFTARSPNHRLPCFFPVSHHYICISSALLMSVVMRRLALTVPRAKSSYLQRAENYGHLFYLTSPAFANTNSSTVRNLQFSTKLEVIPAKQSSRNLQWGELWWILWFLMFFFQKAKVFCSMFSFTVFHQDTQKKYLDDMHTW